MKDASPWIALYAALVATASAVWNLANYALTGGRVKVQLWIGAIGPAGLIHNAPEKASDKWIESLIDQGYTQPVIAVQVANVGRQPITVARWGLRSAFGAAAYPLRGLAGPQLPHRLEVGSAEMWAMDLDEALRFRAVADSVLATDSKRTLFGKVAHRWKAGAGACGVVELADGRTKTSKGRLR